MAKNAMQQLYDNQKQSPWLDYIRRDMLNDGRLQQYIDHDGIRGVTANPTIFEKAIGAGGDYDAQIAQLLHDGVERDHLFEHIAVADITRFNSSAFDSIARSAPRRLGTSAL